MTENGGSSIPNSIGDAAGEWLNQLQGGADLSSDPRFQKWINADPRHRAAFEEAKKDWQLSQLLGGREIGRNRNLSLAPFWMRRNTHLAAASLGVAAIVGVGAFGLMRVGGPLELTASAQAAVYETGIGEIRTVRLTDGSIIVLDTGSRIEVQFTSSARKVEIARGRAHFDVAPDAQRPFRVVAPTGELVAGGTQFDVSLISTPALVTALKGIVELGSAFAPNEPKQLPAGSSLAKGEASVRPAPTSAGLWVKGMLAADAIRLEEAVASMNRYNRVQIRLSDPSLAQLRISGAFRFRDPKGFVETVSKSLGLTHQQSGEIITLYKAR
ncbi:FecR family protein [Sphingobium chlorophenolicum]|uniref:Fe2+-dicitrate sensor membrane component n=1 Tax=Sphingobium chlorophenolicum TaxID=46429 RepID=A0A081R9E5_SPHCR|nr:FecR domain-containing protein [Sphingobium chlorophenolicum]KEQ51818.1 Fe2+-dicitrate sensor membrane component [Sphingobium chlorophenolicum]